MRVIDADCFPQPEDSTGTVWRYMDVLKFESLLRNGLYMCRVDLLGEDTYEGLPHDDQALFQDCMTSGLIATVERTAGSRVAREIQGTAGFYGTFRRRLYASCWQLASDELDWMWNAYCPTQYGVAVRTTYDKLNKYVWSEALDGYEVAIGCVAYGPNTSPDPLTKAMCKRQRYSDEQEIRILCDMGGASNGSAGLFLRARLDQLANAVVISPRAPSGFEREIVRMCQAFSCQLPIERSSRHLSKRA
jgi:hypothetical protein